MSLFPLPLTPDQRQTPLDYLPDVPDTHGRGAKMWDVMSRLRITQGAKAGMTFGEAAAPWQEKYVRALYGTTDSAGLRVFDESLLLISKKQGKSSMAALLAIAHVLANPEDRGTGVVLADTREQARLVYDSMSATIRADKFLAKQFRVQDYRLEITHQPTGTVIKAVSSELASTTGTAASLYIVDELHLLGRRVRGADLVRQLSSGAAVRSEPMGIYLTTSPIDVASGIYSSMVSRARSILAGDHPTDRMLPLVFELPDGVDPDDSRYWWHANPSMGHTVSLEWLVREHTSAMAGGDPTAMQHFYSQHLNLNASEGMGMGRWIQLDEWDTLADPTLTLDKLLERSAKVWISADAGGRDDLTALGVLGESKSGGLMYHCSQWVDAAGYRKRRTQAPLDDFIESGELTVTNGSGADLDALLATVERIRASRPITGAGLDPYKLQHLEERLKEMGVATNGVPQGWKMTPHIFQAERDVLSGHFTHPGGPLLRWNMTNATIEERGPAVALTKPSGASVGAKKIDGAACLVMAFAARTQTPTAKEFQLFFV